jgi:hypothetical protein
VAKLSDEIEAVSSQQSLLFQRASILTFALDGLPNVPQSKSANGNAILKNADEFSRLVVMMISFVN